jgi:hypothetical protein
MCKSTTTTTGRKPRPKLTDLPLHWQMDPTVNAGEWQMLLWYGDDDAALTGYWVSLIPAHHCRGVGFKLTKFAGQGDHFACVAANLNESTCDCPDFEFRSSSRGPCKHLRALTAALKAGAFDQKPAEVPADDAGEPACPHCGARDGLCATQDCLPF